MIQTCYLISQSQFSSCLKITGINFISSQDEITDSDLLSIQKELKKVGQALWNSGLQGSRHQTIQDSDPWVTRNKSTAVGWGGGCPGHTQHRGQT